jgi:hypothetical protein
VRQRTDRAAKTGQDSVDSGHGTSSEHRRHKDFPDQALRRIKKGESKMKRITFVLWLAMLPSFLWFSPAGAQALHPVAVLSLAQAERVAVDLKQGMSAEEVEKLLGRPQRTALKGNGGFPNATSQGTLQWTYSWTGSSAPGNLHIEFVAKTPDQWYVNGWEWGTY